MKLKKLSNYLFWLFIVLMLIPQSRKPIQTFLIRTVGMWAPASDGSETIEKQDLYLRLRSLQAESINLSAGEKPKFISFWASWCPPCIAEFPAIQSLYDDMSDYADFYLITNDDPAKVEAFLKAKGYSLPVYFQEQALSPALEHSSIPYTIVIGSDGSKLFESTGARNWNHKKVRRAIKQSYDQMSGDR